MEVHDMKTRILIALAIMIGIPLVIGGCGTTSGG
jgi:hypothetical protein